MNQASICRAIFLLFLVVFEIGIIAFEYQPGSIETVGLYSINKQYLYGKLQPFVLLLCFIFPFLIWARRGELFPLWTDSLEYHPFRIAFALNILCFFFLFGLSGALSIGGWELTWSIILNILWHLGLVLLLISLLWVIAPFGFWISFFRLFYIEIIIALVVTFLVVSIATYSQSTWNELSEATFHLSYWFLSLYESDIYLNLAERQLAVNGFLIRIDHQCSGYEGIGLIIAFTSVYIFAFRKSLKFPNVFLLYVIGVPLIWVLNGVRIALLASIGGHFSPEVAVTGFHSQAGWMMFLLVTVGLMLVSSQMRFFRLDLPEATEIRKIDPGMELAIALLAPFIALMLASIFVSAFSAGGWGEWLYGLKVLAVGVVLWWYRGIYAELVDRVSFVSILAGLGVAVLWIVMDNDAERQVTLANWVGALSQTGFATWFSVRLAGTVIMVPIAEELAFRSYVYRAFIGRRFETVSHGQFAWIAFIGSTLMFAAMHAGRFTEAFIAGGVFALVMVRTGRISDAVAAHMVANLAIAIWACISGQWSLL